MNNSIAVFLVNDDVRAVKVSYEGKDAKDKYVVASGIFKTFDPDMKTGDMVVVPTETRVGFTVVEVVEVDVDVDFDSNSKAQWIVAKVDREAYRRTLKDEDQLVELVKSANKAKKKRELREAFIADAEGVEDLPIVANVTPAIEAPQPSKDDIPF